MKIALVHDYLSQDGGAERVLKAMHEIWPEAPIFVLFHDKKKIDNFGNAKVRESFISKLPFCKQIFEWYLPLMPLATEKYFLKDFDVVISSTSGFAKGVIVHPHTTHISYCHTPPRYLWADTHEYIDDLNSNIFVKTILPFFTHRLRLWDKISADRVDHFIANSQTVQNRIKKYYRRDSTVIHPPVDTDKFFISDKIGEYFVAGGRLVPYKRVDIAVQAFNRLGWSLKVFGIGPELEKLKKMARSNIEFLGKISEEEKAILLSHARAFIHPQIEDFGITPVEAMASGRPVIAYKSGGATETIKENETGIFFSEQNWESIYNLLKQFKPEAWNGIKIRESSLKYCRNSFKNNLVSLVNDLVNA